MSTAQAHAFLLRLLFDADLRGRFFADRAGTMAEEGLGEADAAVFREIDRHGLELDASIRRDYLMSALLRAYPLSGAMLGSLPGGAERLASFLASGTLYGDTAKRTAAFGEHLERLVRFNPTRAPPTFTGLVESVLAFEKALVNSAAQLRADLAQGISHKGPAHPDAKRLATGKPRIPDHSVIAELPFPTAVLKTALDHAGPEDAWHLVRTGRLSFERVLSVARADAMPVTVFARAYARGNAVERAGVGGALVEVAHLTVELTGRRAEDIHVADGTRTLAQVPERVRRLLSRLAEEGALELA